MPTLTGLDGSVSGIVRADGTLELSIRPNVNAQWVVRQVNTNMPTAPLGAQCELRKNGRFVTAMIPQNGSAVEPPPVYLWQADTASVVWTDCTPGDSGTITWLYDQVTR
jgi:hypothetical protein